MNRESLPVTKNESAQDMRRHLPSWRRLQMNMKRYEKGVHEMCTIILSPPTWFDCRRQRGWIWTRFYLVPPPPPSFGDDLQGGFGDFYFIFPRQETGKSKRFDWSGLQKAMSSPRAAGFSFVRFRIKNQNARRILLLRLQKTE